MTDMEDGGTKIDIVISRLSDIKTKMEERIFSDKKTAKQGDMFIGRRARTSLRWRKLLIPRQPAEA